MSAAYLKGGFPASYPKREAVKCPHPEKRAWPSKASAEEFIAYRARAKRPGKLWAYQCPCQYWHTTKQKHGTDR